MDSRERLLYHLQAEMKKRHAGKTVFPGLPADRPSPVVYRDDEEQLRPADDVLEEEEL